LEDLAPIRTTPRTNHGGKPFDYYVQKMVVKGDLRRERISAKILRTPRDLEVYRSVRKSAFISDWKNMAEDASYCCEYWADLKIGRGACGFRCAECFLILTHRVKADPSRHELYENVDDFYRAVNTTPTINSCFLVEDMLCFFHGN